MKFSRMADKFIFKWKTRFSPFRITYQFWIWPIPSYLKELPCALRTPSTCWWSQWKLQYSVKKKRNMNVHLGIIWEVFKNSRHINIQMKAYVLPPFRITYQFWIWPISSYLKEPLRVHFALLQLAGALSGNNTIQCKKREIWMYTWV